MKSENIGTKQIRIEIIRNRTHSEDDNEWKEPGSAVPAGLIKQKQGFFKNSQEEAAWKWMTGVYRI